MSISVLIYTKNEELDILACLNSFSWCDDIHLVDSGSTDNTVRIAQEFGANVVIKQYDNSAPFGGDESAHRNWSINHLSFKYDWVYHSDADERVSAEFVQTLKTFIENADGAVAARVRRKDYFFDTWLKHVTPSPFNIRLFKKDAVRYERVINPLTIIDGEVRDLACYFDHYPFSKGITHWVNKHNIYSTLEAEQININRQAQHSFSLYSAFFEADLNKKRSHQKELFYRLPLRPLVKFLLLYIGKRGFLDGKAGFHYALLQSVYEYFIVLKTKEIQALK